MLVGHLKAKPTPFFYLDTHAGRGRYDLSHAQAQRSGEYLGGIGRLLKVEPSSLLPEVSEYLDLVRRSAGPGHSPITSYPGSPRVVDLLRRGTDRMVLAEKHSGEAAALRETFEHSRRVTVLEQDGYAALKAHLPPAERRGLVLIDPPYESDTEFDTLL